jgi:hypothetical protein
MHIFFALFHELQIEFALAADPIFHKSLKTLALPMHRHLA